MRFLENLVSDLLKDATGIDTRRAVRRIGGKRLLLMGGLAAAGALTQQKRAGAATSGGAGAASGSSSYAFTKGSGTAPGAGGAAARTPPPRPPRPDPSPVPPRPDPGPIPPPPGPGGPTPIPPPPGPGGPPPPAPPAAAEAFEEIEDDLPPHLLLPAVRTMIAAALADGRLAAEEKAAIERRLADSDLPPDDAARVHRDLVFPPTVDELAALVEPPAERELLFELACLVLRADAEIGELERAWLARLGTALEIPEARQQELTADIFV